jgi:cyclophilin family peptidyl-prolyl cis-trans isomerase
MKLKIISFVMPVLLLLMISAATAQTARLQVIHNAADVAADPVDIYLNGTLLLDDFGFRDATPFIDAPAGVTLNIGVAPGTSSSVNDTLVNFQAMLENGGTYVVIANGVLDPNAYSPNPDGRSTAFTLFVKSMARESASGSGVDFFVVHGSTDAPTVDVIARNVATLVDNAAYGDITDYINVPAASYTLDVTPGDDENTIVASFEADLSGLDGGSAVVFASGFLDPSMNQNGEPFGIFAALSDGTVIGLNPVETARLQVIHNAADVAADPVDIYLNGTLLLDDFGFRAATPFIDAPAGVTLNIGVAPGTSSSVNDTLVNFQAMLENGGTYVVIANGVLDPNAYAPNPDGKSTAFTLFVKSMARESASGSGVDFFVVHGSTDAPTVDVIARNVATLVDNAAYGDITDYINVPAGAYTLDITPGDDNSTIVASFDADLTGLEGGSAVVFASGFLDPSMNQNGEPFGIFAALSDGTVVGFSTVTSNEANNNNIVPVEYGLQQNYPNPFNPSTNIQFSIPEQQLVQLKVYNVIGQEVATLVNDVMNQGNYSVAFNADNFSSGVYFYKLETGKFSEVKKMILAK